MLQWRRPCPAGGTCPDNKVCCFVLITWFCCKPSQQVKTEFKRNGFIGISGNLFSPDETQRCPDGTRSCKLPPGIDGCCPIQNLRWIKKTDTFPPTHIRQRVCKMTCVFLGLESCIFITDHSIRLGSHLGQNLDKFVLIIKNSIKFLSSVDHAKCDLLVSPRTQTCPRRQNFKGAVVLPRSTTFCEQQTKIVFLVINLPVNSLNLKFFPVHHIALFVLSSKSCSLDPIPSKLLPQPSVMCYYPSSRL